MTSAIHRRLEALERQAKREPRESDYDLARLGIEQLRRLHVLVGKHEDSTLDDAESTDLKVILALAMPEAAKDSIESPRNSSAW